MQLQHESAQPRLDGERIVAIEAALREADDAAATNGRWWGERSAFVDFGAERSDTVREAPPRFPRKTTFSRRRTIAGACVESARSP